MCRRSVTEAAQEQTQKRRIRARSPGWENVNVGEFEDATVGVLSRDRWEEGGHTSPPREGATAGPSHFPHF